MSLAGRELILGVSGSIAAYKAAYLLRELTRLGAGVTVVTTEHAREYSTQTEELYLAALDVTLQRHLFAPRPFARTGLQ